MIRLEHLNKTFRSHHRTVHVINDVTQSIAEGSFFTLLGPSGCGKTTTLRVIAGLDRHDAGSIWFGDRLISCPEKRIFTAPSDRDIGMVFQSYAIWPHMDVYHNVAYPLTTRRRRGMPADEIRRRVSEAVDLVGLGTLLHSPSTALSGGQQQRVALARALVAQPQVLLLDEPLSNLDALLRERMRGELTQLQRKIRVTSIYVTHDRAEALSMSDQVAVMNGGRIEMTGTPSAVYKRPTTAFVARFLGHCNFIDGTVRDRTGTAAGVADTPFGPVAIDMVDVPPPGASVKILVRPEDLVVAPAPAAGGNVKIRARIVATMYFGERQEHEAVTAGQTLRFNATGQPVAGDADIELALREPRCWALPAQIVQ
jgi:iron(III) transport system ATP-binding protein